MMPMSSGSWWVRACPPVVSCPTLCNPIDCSLPCSSLHGEWVAMFSSSDLPNPGIEPSPGERFGQGHLLPQSPPWLVGGECSPDVTTEGPQESSQNFCLHSWLAQNGGAFSDSCTQHAWHWGWSFSLGAVLGPVGCRPALWMPRAPPV